MGIVDTVGPWVRLGLNLKYIMQNLISKLQIRQNDRLAVNKLVSSLTRGTARSPLAQCLLVRYASQVCFRIWSYRAPIFSFMLMHKWKSFAGC